MALNVKDYPSFQALIVALADKYHEGHPYPMGERVGVAVGTAQQWHNGTIKAPTIPRLRLLSDAYGLDLGDLINLVSKPARRGKLARAIRGGAGRPGTLDVVQLLDKTREYCLLSDVARWLRSILAPGLLPQCALA